LNGAANDAEFRKIRISRIDLNRVIGRTQAHESTFAPAKTRIFSDDRHKLENSRLLYD